METYSTSKVQSWLIWFLRGVLLLAGFILIARLIEIQVIKGEYFRQLSEGNRIRRIPITAPRGNIIASGGEVMVSNREVQKILEFDPVKGFVKIVPEEGVSNEQLISEWERDYLSGDAASHITGYVGEVGSEGVGKISAECPEKGEKVMGQKVGRTGLEEQYNCILTGIPGEELVEVDSFGNRIAVLGAREPVPGGDIKTTIDLPLQKRISYLMKDRKGAVIVTNTKGEVLSLVSSPVYDPNYFVGKNQQNIKSILESEDLPLFNRAIGGSFAPGSIYKPIISVAGLSEGDIDEDYTYNDTGTVEINTNFGNFTYRNWYFTQYGGVEGEIGIKRAIARSTDTFFYKLGESLGIGNIVKWSERFGLSDKAEIDIPGEITSLIPSPGWKQQVKGERWFLGNTFHVSIGQGDISLTPISINRAISVIASDGNLCKNKIVSEYGDEDEISRFNLGEDQEEKEFCTKIEVEKKHLELVTEGMVEACSGGGTGLTFFEINHKADEGEEFLITKSASGERKVRAHKVACKTGTAQTGEESEPHAWFTFFAPAENPEIVVTVLVENGGEGSKVAGPIAREIYDQWFSEE